MTLSLLGPSNSQVFGFLPIIEPSVIFFANWTDGVSLLTLACDTETSLGLLLDMPNNTAEVFVSIVTSELVLFRFSSDFVAESRDACDTWDIVEIVELKESFKGEDFKWI